MITNKYKKIQNIRQNTSVENVILTKNPEQINISLAFPPVFDSTNTGYLQLSVILLDTNSNVIQHKSIDEFDQYLSLNTIVKCAKIHTIHSTKTGKLQTGKYDTIIDSGKNKGKKSETSILQQALQYCQSKYNKLINCKNDSYPHFMLLDLYKYQKNSQIKLKTITQIAGTNKPKQKKNVLQTDNNSLLFPQYIQRKYDGLRCGCLMLSNDQIKFVSRGQKEFNSLIHLQQEMQQVFDFIRNNSDIYKELVQICSKYDDFISLQDINTIFDFSSSLLFDGELYAHGKSLQSINSFIRNPAQTSDKLLISFIIYDIDLTLSNRTKQIALPFSDRNSILSILSRVFQQLNIQSVSIAPTIIAHSDQELQTLFSSYIEQQYEGAVIRSPQSLYCYSINNKRSRDTLKYKLKLDMEVQIIGFSSGIGKDTNCIIFDCIVPQITQQNTVYNTPKTTLHEQSVFQVVQNTTYDSRKSFFELLKKNPQYLSIISQIPFNIEYSALSEIGIPQQPRGIYFRFDQLSQSFIKELRVPDDLMPFLV